MAKHNPKTINGTIMSESHVVPIKPPAVHILRSFETLNKMPILFERACRNRETAAPAKTSFRGDKAFFEVMPIPNTMSIPIAAPIKELNTSIKKVSPGKKAIVMAKASDVLISHGYNREFSLTFDETIQPTKTDDYRLKSIGQCKTAVPGIFEAGDIIDYEDKVNLLAGTFQDAVLAVNSAKIYIDPKAEKCGMVSSHNEQFMERNRQLLEQAFA